jgi:hypothetical protein
MNKKQIALGVVFLDFLALTAYAVTQYGFVGIFEQAVANAASLQLFADLVIALSLVMAWMWQDARQRGISPIPYVLLTLALGSFGPLLYLIRRLGHDAVVTSPGVLPGSAHVARAGA